MHLVTPFLVIPSLHVKIDLITTKNRKGKKRV